MPPHVPFPVHRVRNSLGRMPSRIMVTKATVARQHVWNALLDRVVMAVPFQVAGADRHHRTPRCVPIGLAGWNIEAKCRRQGGDREHQSNDSFHRDSPDAWRTALLVEGIIGALRQINYSQKRAACCLLLARIRPEQTTVIAATTETPRGERLHAVGAHVVECHRRPGVAHQPSSVWLFLACPTGSHGQHGYFAQTTTRGPPVVSGLIPQDTV